MQASLVSALSGPTPEASLQHKPLVLTRPLTHPFQPVSGYSVQSTRRIGPSLDHETLGSIVGLATLVQVMGRSGLVSCGDALRLDGSDDRQEQLGGVDDMVEGQARGHSQVRHESDRQVVVGAQAAKPKRALSRR